MAQATFNICLGGIVVTIVLVVNWLGNAAALEDDLLVQKGSLQGSFTEASSVERRSISFDAGDRGDKSGHNELSLEYTSIERDGILCSSVHGNISKPSKPASRLLLSLLMYEEMWYITSLLKNLLAFTSNQTIIVIHLSQGSNYTTTELEFLKHFSPRIWINPERIVTRAFHGSLFRAHMLNLDHALRIGPTHSISFTHLMICSSNSRLFRAGLEQYIFKHDSSLGIKDGRSPYDFGFAFHKRADDPGRWVHRAMRWTPLRSVITTFPNGTKSMLITKVRPTGSFYPMQLMKDLLEALNNFDGAWESTNRVYSILEEFVWATWSDLRRERAGRADGHTVIASMTMSSGKNESWTPTPEQLKSLIAHQKEWFGFKALSRRKDIDIHGTREFVENITRSRLNSLCMG